MARCAGEAVHAGHSAFQGEVDVDAHQRRPTGTRTRVVERAILQHAHGWATQHIHRARSSGVCHRVPQRVFVRGQQQDHPPVRAARSGRIVAAVHVVGASV